MDKRMQPHEAYRALPAKVAQHVLKQLADAWKAFREAKASYEEDPSRFTGRPKLPKYKHKTEGRNILIYTMQAVSRGKRSLQRGIIKPSMLPIEVKTQQDPKTIDQVRIIPRNGHYVVSTVSKFVEQTWTPRSRRPESVRHSQRSCHIPRWYRLRYIPKEHVGWDVPRWDQR